MNCGAGGVVALVIDQHFDSIAFGEPGHESFPVLENSADQVSGDADVKRAAPTTRKDIDPEAHSA